MKKYLCNTMLFLSSVVIASCTKDLNEVTSIGGPVSKVFEAVAEKQVDVKTSLSGNKVAWTSGDVISVFGALDNAPFELTEVTESGTGVFSGNVADADIYYALYPYNASASITAEGVITTTLPSNQYGVRGTFDTGLNMSVAKMKDGKFNMKNVCGLVAFEIKRSDVVSVSLFGNGHEYLSGEIEITLDDDGKPNYTVKNGAKYVNLMSKDGQPFEPGVYYFVVLPQTLKGGMSLVYMTSTAQSGTVASSSDAVVNRSVCLTITSNTEAYLKMTDVIDLSDPDKTSNPETANCYVAGQPGRRYCFPATVMGNGYTFAADDSYTVSAAGSSPVLAPKTLTPNEAKLLWQTSRSLLKHVILENGYVYFTLNGQSGGSLTSGNALIAVLGDDHLPEWSWHIWVTDANLEQRLQTWTVHENVASYSAYQNPQLMDRNLGATTDLLWGDSQTNGAHGLFYQWGRKDPFMGPDDSSRGSTTQLQTFDECDVAHKTKSKLTSFPTDFQWYNKSGAFNDDNVAKYPMVFCIISNGTYWNPTKHNLWGRPPYPIEDNKLGYKTIYDPCPPGYRVMNQYAWSGISSVWQGGKFADLIDDDGNPLHNVVNMSGTQLIRDDGGMKVQYDGVNVSFIPNTGHIINDTDVVDRCKDYGYYWTSSMSATTSQRGVIQNFDYNTINLMSLTNNYAKACRGNAVRCEKIK